MKKSLLLLFLVCGLYAQSQNMEESFLHPPHESRPLMIWQWMDGLISEEGITADLEAYAEAGIGGVQQFQVGGPMQIQVSDTTKAIGTDEWKRMMRHAIHECSRLGLSFGTHNCPGWSSSAYPTVSPEYSMQKLVWSVIKTEGGKVRITLAKPEIDKAFDFYRDIAVVATPDADSIGRTSIVNLSYCMDTEGHLIWNAPKGSWRIYRFGHTTNGKTNDGTAPYGGVGLECDKMSREALDHYWKGYPQMLFNLVPEELGKTFKRIEIDSYEAGGQEWTRLMLEEFLKRRGYDITAWLPALAGITIDSREVTKRFTDDWRNTVRELFAENYYGYMSQLVHQHQGMQLLAQPYGTGSAKPFNPIDTKKIVSQMAPDDIICAEFWSKPDNWGWPDVPRVVSATREDGREIVYAEGFTCWPLHAWKDDPNDLKATADRAFCLGINQMMLHAAAHNPWVGRKPGMTFGIWGTWWTPGQTWWQSGSAKELFTYMSRCQSLLQRGRFVDDFRSQQPSLTNGEKALQWTHRRDGDIDIYFIANTKDTTLQTDIILDITQKTPEIWHPERAAIQSAVAWQTSNGKTTVRLKLDTHEAIFLVLRAQTGYEGPGLTLKEPLIKHTFTIDTPWAVIFGDHEADTTYSHLTSWTEHQEPTIKYFSGTARYSNSLKVKKLSKGERYILDLGQVKNLAKVYVNGTLCAHLWRPPFQTDITELLHKGENEIVIEVTNLWINRLVGDEQEPDDVEWTEPMIFGHAPGTPKAGRFMAKVPDWLANNWPRPSKGRKAVISFKFYEKDAPLLPSGLLGPVTIQIICAD